MYIIKHKKQVYQIITGMLDAQCWAFINYKMTVKSKVQMSSSKAQNSKIIFYVKFKQ